uniref:Uncharacterized protein n=1 Tax=Brassica oleracea var. oleracea TaxID=109376 RepID=A0A0D3E9Y4_BRAOL
SVVSGLLALLKVERDKIGAAPYDGCLRTLVEGIKPFVIRLGVKRLGIARDDREMPRMISKTRQVMKFWPQIKPREDGCYSEEVQPWGFCNRFAALPFSTNNLGFFPKDIRKKYSGELCTRFDVLPFSAVNLGFFCGLGESKFNFSEKLSKNVF